MPRHWLAVLGCVLWLFAVSPAAEPLAPDLVVVTTFTGKPLRGPWHSLAADWALRLGPEGERRLGPDDWFSLRRPGPLPLAPVEEQVVLVNGDRLPVRDLRLDGEKLVFTHPDLGDREVSVTLDAVALVWRIAPERTAVPERLRRRLATGPRPRDTVLLRNGDVIEGTLTLLDGKAVEVETADKKPRSVRLGQVAAVALSTELAGKTKPPAAFARVALAPSDRAPGGRVTLTSATCEGGVFRGKTTFGALVRVPAARVAALDLFGDRVISLSSLTPTKYEYLPYLDERWDWMADATVTGRDLRLGGGTFDRGVSMHGHARLTWKLPAGVKRFEALVGLDDVDGAAGRASVRVLADGVPVELGGKADLTPGVVLPVSVPLVGAKELTLEVLHGAGGPVGDVVTWADARLVK